MPAIHAQITPRHKTARVADQEHRGAAILLGRADAAQHVLARPALAALRVQLEQLVDHGRLDVARRHGVDPDAVLAPFRGQVARELQDAGFAGVVRGTDEALTEKKRIMSA